jgi:hypothetical protein
MADRITTYRTAAHVVSAGATAACPTRLAARVAVLPPADRAWLKPTAFADDFLTTAALADAVVADQMSGAIQGYSDQFCIANVTARAAQRAAVAILKDAHRRLAFPVGQYVFQDRGRRFQRNISHQFDLHTQPVIFNLFGDFAVQVRFQRPPFLTVGVVRIVDFLDLLLVVSCQPVERFMQTR